jgi:hypothetical protein
VVQSVTTLRGQTNVDAIVQTLLDSPEPAVRYKVRTGALGEDPGAPALRTLREQIPSSPLVATLLARRDRTGRIPGSVYAKWQGAHWIMAALADIGYPPGDSDLAPVRDQLLDQWLDARYYREFPAASRAQAYALKGVPVMQGRHRRCASQQSNALWSIVRLGLVDDRTHELVERLLHWQWPDGGWNCDKDPDACHSSFMESILPLRALACYGHTWDHRPALDAATRAAEIFLERRLHLRQTNGRLIKAEFGKLHYPLYWHYDVLHGLKVMAEAGFIGDPRCTPALELLMSKRLPDGGWPAEARYYKVSAAVAPGNDSVDWGRTSARRFNPWVTVDALYVLRMWERPPGRDVSIERKRSRPGGRSHRRS